MCSEKGIDRPSMNGAFQAVFFNISNSSLIYVKSRDQVSACFFAPSFRKLYMNHEETKLSSFLCPNVQMTNFLCFFFNR